MDDLKTAPVKSPPHSSANATKNSAALVDKWFRIFTETLPMANSLKPSPVLLEVWHTLFDARDPEELERACTAAMSKCKFFPSPAEIEEFLAQPHAISADLTAEREWQNALRCASQYDPDLAYGSPQSLDWRGKPAWRDQPDLSPAGEHAVRAAGGWNALHDAHYDPEQETWRRKTFLEAYRTFSKGAALGLTEGDSKKLLGKIEGVEQLIEGKKL